MELLGTTTLNYKKSDKQLLSNNCKQKINCKLRILTRKWKLSRCHKNTTYKNYTGKMQNHNMSRYLDLHNSQSEQTSRLLPLAEVCAPDCLSFSSL